MSTNTRLSDYLLELISLKIYKTIVVLFVSLWLKLWPILLSSSVVVMETVCLWGCGLYEEWYVLLRLTVLTNFYSLMTILDVEMGNLFPCTFIHG